MLGIAWALILAAAPALPHAAQAALYAIGAMICHQRPERSFHVAGSQLPVCARCFGIYLGAAVGAAVTVGRWIIALPTAAAPWTHRFTPRGVLAIVGLPTITTVVLEWARVWDPHNIGRAVAGVVLGAGMAAVVLTLHYGECAPPRPNVPYRPTTPF